MTEKFTVVDIDENGNAVERPMTVDEIAIKNADTEKIAELQALADARKAARESRRAKLLALGLTEEELDA